MGAKFVRKMQEPETGTETETGFRPLLVRG